MVALARAQARAQRRQLAEYEGLLERFGIARSTLAAFSAELGARLARAAAELWEEIAEREQGQLPGGDAQSAA